MLSILFDFYTILQLKFLLLTISRFRTTYNFLLSFASQSASLFYLLLAWLLIFLSSNSISFCLMSDAIFSRIILLSILIYLLYCSVLQAFSILSIACLLSVKTLTIILHCTSNKTNQILTSSALVDIGQLTTFKFSILTILFSI